MEDQKDRIAMQGPVCPMPLPHEEQIILGHGSGGRLTHQLIERLFYQALGNPVLRRAEDAAVVEAPDGSRLAICTDSHVVKPLFFPGGDIGRLSVCGTVNDLAMMGARPRWITAAFILEEGFPLAELERVLASMQEAAAEAGVLVVAGDTKVAERGGADGLFISTSGVGWIPAGRQVSARRAQAGDALLLSGTLGDHGMAVLAARGELALEGDLRSDVAPLNGLVEALFAAGVEVHVLRDPTRGGLATTLWEIARQSQVGIELDEASLPVRPEVKGACELLGFDPLYVANEGKLVAIVPQAQAERALQAMTGHPLGRQGASIGRVQAEPAGRVLMRTAIGARRVVEPLSGEMLPRIC